MIAIDAEPFLVVERPGFQKLMTTLSPRYQLPSRRYFSEKVVPQVYEDLRIKVIANSIVLS